MKVEKNKIVFAMVLATILLFLIAYSVMLLGEDEGEDDTLEQTLVPELQEEQQVYDSKLDAINDLKEVRETNAPSIYDEKLIDSAGVYDPGLPDREKERIVDSIYEAGRIRYSQAERVPGGNRKAIPKMVTKMDSAAFRAEQGVQAKELGLDHQLFFASAPQVTKSSLLGVTDATIPVVVQGDQVVKTNSRLRMRLIRDAVINGRLIPKNTDIFGFISFLPNRALIEIENVAHHPTALRAFDLQDGSEGIYVQNGFRAEATGEVIDDIIQDINIPSVPQLGGIGQVLRRRNRNVKVTILNNYRLLLKPKQ